MQAIDRDRPLIPLTIAVIRANPAPFALAVAASFAAYLIGFADVAADPVGITWLTVAKTLLLIAAHTLATLFAAWAFTTHGRPAGLSGLAQIPPERIRPFIAYGVLFGLWTIVFTAVFSGIAGAIVPGGIAGAIVGAGAVALALVLVYVQLGFLFPDTLHSGQSGVLIAMIMGIVSVRRMIAALVLPALLISLPLNGLTLLALNGETLQRLGAVSPLLSLPDLALTLAISAFSVVGWVMYGLAVTRTYFDILPAAQKNQGQFFT